MEHMGFPSGTNTWDGESWDLKLLIGSYGTWDEQLGWRELGPAVGMTIARVRGMRAIPSGGPNYSMSAIPSTDHNFTWVSHPKCRSQLHLG